MFSNRHEAGEALAQRLSAETFAESLILALPRGGVPVAQPVAQALDAPIDLLMVRKLGLPDQPEVAAGAVVEGPPSETVFNTHILAASRLGEADFRDMIATKLEEIADRRQLYLGGRAPIDVEGHDVIVVDDGIATGATVRAGLQALRRRNPASITLAVPVAPQEALDALAPLAERVICLETPAPFWAVGAHYTDFAQVDDDEVIALLSRRDTLPAEKENP